MANEKLAELRRTLLEKAAVLQQMDQQSSTTEKLEERYASLEKQYSALVEAESREAAVRLLDGEDAAPPNANRRKKLLAINEQKDPLPATITLSRQREVELKTKSDQIDQSIASLAFSAASEIRMSAAQAIKGGLDALAPYVVRMAAADGILRGLTDKQPTLSPDQIADEFSGGFVAEKLIRGLTFFVRPDNLENDTFAKAVAEETARLVTQTKEGRSDA
jgi:hypothetical protein